MARLRDQHFNSDRLDSERPRWSVETFEKG
jgi:hypothetical protein